MTVELHVYDGQVCIGRIVETDHGRVAYGADGRVLGTFASRKAAVAANVAAAKPSDRRAAA